jgi:hypothetical protein
VVKDGNIVTKTVESVISPIVHGVTSLVSTVGNLAIAVPFTLERKGFINTMKVLDVGNGLMTVAQDQAFHPYKYKFPGSLVQQKVNYSSDGTINYTDGMSILKGTTTIITVPLQLGVGGFLFKFGTFQGLGILILIRNKIEL